MSTRFTVVLGISLGLGLLNAPAVSAQLTVQQEVQGVTRCQDTIDRQARTFLSTVQRAVEGCAQVKLSPVLRAENGLISPERFDAENNQATQICNRLIAVVATAAPRFIDGLVAACGPVESIVMAPDPPPAGDPLGLVAEWGASTVEEVAGFICGESIAEGFFLATGKIPRGTEILLADPDIVFPPLDPRCTF
jgi:hypothetical protein